MTGNKSANGSMDANAEISVSEDAVVVAVWGLMLIYGLIANCLVLVGIMRSNSMKKATSYWLIMSLSVCDIMMILISLFHLLPATAFHNRFVSVFSARNIWALFLYNTVWYTGVLKLGLMAFNRFISIVRPTDYPVMFSKQRTVYIIGCVYALGLAVSVPTLFPCCHMVWNHYYYVTFYEPEDTNYFIVDILVNTASLVAMIVCYSIILIRVRQSRRALARYRSTLKRLSSQETNGPSSVVTTYAALSAPPRATLSKREMRLFLQFFVVSLVFLFTYVNWQWLPRIGVSKWIYFSMTSFFFINNAVNPTVYFIFNTTLRREIRNVFVSKPNVIKNNGESLTPGANDGSRGSSEEKQKRISSPPPFQSAIGSPHNSLREFALQQKQQNQENGPAKRPAIHQRLLRKHNSATRVLLKELVDGAPRARISRSRSDGQTAGAASFPILVERNCSRGPSVTVDDISQFEETLEPGDVTSFTSTV